MNVSSKDKNKKKKSNYKFKFLFPLFKDFFGYRETPRKAKEKKKKKMNTNKNRMKKRRQKNRKYFFQCNAAKSLNVPVHIKALDILNRYSLPLRHSSHTLLSPHPAQPFKR